VEIWRLEDLKIRNVLICQFVDVLPIYNTLSSPPLEGLGEVINPFFAAVWSPTNGNVKIFSPLLVLSPTAIHRIILKTCW
jgi:hypothetical protein